MIEITLIFLLVVSLLTNASFFFINKKLVVQMKQNQGNPDNSLEILSELSRSGRCVVKIIKVDQSEMFLRSPK